MRILVDYYRQAARQQQLYFSVGTTEVQTNAGVGLPPHLWTPWEQYPGEREVGLSRQATAVSSHKWTPWLYILFCSTLPLLHSHPSVLAFLHYTASVELYVDYMWWRHPFVSEKACCDIVNLVSVCPRALINSIFIHKEKVALTNTAEEWLSSCTLVYCIQKNVKSFFFFWQKGNIFGASNSKKADFSESCKCSIPSKCSSFDF